MKRTPEFYMRSALDLAVAAEKGGEVPVGAIIEYAGRIIGRGSNCPVNTSDPSGHAEIVALRDAGQSINNYRLNGANLYITLEPCIMCYAAAVHARINKIFYGASDPKSGIFSTGAFEKIEKIFNHKIEIECGFLKEESSEILKIFFRDRR